MKTIPLLLSVCICLQLSSIHLMAQSKDNTLPPGSYKTIFEMLKDVPGLEVRTSNDKTGGTVVVRGVGSLNNQRAPLIVVDGMVYNGDISNINTQDVAGISVLKDAASATAYGAQGAFGVILITTKKGSGVVNRPIVASHTESAYTYFIEHQTALKIIRKDNRLLYEGVIHHQNDSAIVFVKKKKETVILLKDIDHVEMIRE